MSFCLLRWLKYSSWLLLGVISLASAFFITLYSLELDRDQASRWVTSMTLSVLQDVFISQPIKVREEPHRLSQLWEAGETEAKCPDS